jgi:hypothetical protein
MSTAATQPVETKCVAERRDPRFETLEDVLADLDDAERAHEAGALRTLGNWSAGQIYDHVAILFEGSLDGFPPEKPALPLRIAGRGFYWLLRLGVIRGPMKPGIRFPKGVSWLDPRDDVSFEQGARRLRDAIERVQRGEKMKHKSPLLGMMRHEDWLGLHCSHASMHFSFIRFE